MVQKRNLASLDIHKKFCRSSGGIMCTVVNLYSVCLFLFTFHITGISDPTASYAD